MRDRRARPRFESASPDIGGNRRDLLAPKGEFRARLRGHAQVGSGPTLSNAARCTSRDRRAVLVNAIFTCPIILPCRTRVSPTLENIPLKDRRILRMPPRWSDGRPPAQSRQLSRTQEGPSDMDGPWVAAPPTNEQKLLFRSQASRPSRGVVHTNRFLALLRRSCWNDGKRGSAGMTGGNRAADESSRTLLQARRG